MGLRKGEKCFQKKTRRDGGNIEMQENGKIRVVIADRDMYYLQKLKLCLERKGDMTVIGMTDNGPAAFSLIAKTRPDVVLLDAILGEKDGVWVLENMKQQQITCVSIMISAIDSDTVVRRAMAMGADYYMAKPIQGDLLLERIRQLTEQHMPYQKTEKILLAPQQTQTQPRETELSLEAEISAVLSRMGVPASIKGYHFIRQAVLMAVKDREIMVGITKGLYPDIAKMYHTTASKVERAIRHAVESAWKKNGRQVYFEISGYMMEEKPTNGQFIAILAEHFRMQYNTSFPILSFRTQTENVVKTDREIAFS